MRILDPEPLELTPHQLAIEELMWELKRLADNAYCNMAAQSKTPNCLGEKTKIRNGTLGALELEAHKKAAEQLGRHRAFHEALVLARSAYYVIRKGNS